MDYWAENGGGVNTVKALGTPATAGTGAFGGVLSTPCGWVWASITVSLVCAAVLGLTSVKLTALVTPTSHDAETAVAEAEVGGRGVSREPVGNAGTAEACSAGPARLAPGHGRSRHEP